MLNLPFDKWSLKFHDIKYEPLFEEEQNAKRLLSFRFITMSITFLATVFLIVFLLQRQPNVVIIVLSIITVGSFGLFMLSKKLAQYLKHAYSIFYIWTLITGILISYSGLQIPLYVYGFYTSSVLFVMLSFSENRCKLFYVFFTPCLILGMFGQFTLDTISWVVLAFLYSMSGGILAHINEYTARLAFSLNMIVEKQQSIINEFVTDSLFGLSLDDRTQQFILEFSNKTFEKNFIKDTIQVKEFLRSYSINDENKIEFHKEDQKNISLEEYLFHFIKIKEEIIDTQKLSCLSNIKGTEQQHITIRIKKIDYCKQILLISIENEKLPQIIDQYEKQLTENNIFAKLAFSQIAKSTKNISQELLKIQGQYKSQQLQLIYCLNMKTLNQVRNFQLYNSKLKVQTLEKPIVDNIKLTTYLQMLSSYFSLISQKYHKQFQMLNFIETDLECKINLKYLTQVLLNTFNFVIHNSLNKITLEIIKEININPLNENKLFTYDRQDEQFDLSVIKFSFIFTNKQITTNNFSVDFFEKDESIGQKELNIQNNVSNLLLGILGPYKQLYHKQIQNESFQETFLNELKFYIYSDQSQIDISYIKNINL